MDNQEIISFKNRNIFQTNDMMGGSYWLPEIPSLEDGENSKELEEVTENTPMIKLNLIQTKILKIAFAMANPKQLPNTTPEPFTFTVEELLDLMDIKNNPKTQYIDLPVFLNRLMLNDAFGYKIGRNKYRVIHVFDSVDYDAVKRIVIFRFSMSMLEKLSSNKKGNYQSFKLGNLLGFTSLYTVNLYEMLKRELRGRKTHIYTIRADDLRIDLDVDNNKYPAYYDFKRYVLKKSVDEINNNKTDLTVGFTETKRGRFVDTISFEINNCLEIKEIDNIKAENNELIQIVLDLIKQNLSEEDKKKITYKQAESILEDAKYDIELVNREYYKVISNVKVIKSIVAVLRDSIQNPSKYSPSVGIQQLDIFNNYDQRTYDYDDLERKLLGWDNPQEEVAIDGE